MMNGYYPEGWNKSDSDRQINAFTAAGLTEAFQKQEILEAPVTMCDASHNLLVSLGQFKGIIPREEGAIGISDGSTRDIALISRVGKSVCFCISDLKSEGDGFILSRKKAQELCRDNIIRTKKPGDIISAKVTHLESFGAFCDIGCGNIALLPIDAISVSRISHPKDRFSVGDDIKVIIKSIDGDGRITLSHKELLGSWEENAVAFSAGQTVKGVIRSIEDYGVFVELSPNLAGLAEPKEGAYIGKQASVFIKSIIREKMKIKLIIIDSFDKEYRPEIKYFYKGDSIERWNYSPKECSKQIYSIF